jgi:hypothetical protein
MSVSRVEEAAAAKLTSEDLAKIDAYAESLHRRTLLGHALDYAKHRWLVLPLHAIREGECTCGNAVCSSPGKHPRTLHGLKDASTDQDVLRDWWRRWPDANIGIATGSESGLLVIDVDAKSSGLVSFSALLEKEGVDDAQIATVTAETGGGGFHLLFCGPEGQVPNSAGKLAKGVDVRGDGGYIVAAPSTHASGKRYAWIDGAGPGQTKLATVPAELLARMRGDARTASADLRRESRVPVYGPASPALIEEARKALARHGPATQGQGGDQHTFTAMAVLTHDYALTEDESWPLAAEWNKTCAPPWDEDELRTKVGNAARYAKGECGAARDHHERATSLAERIRERPRIESTQPPTQDSYDASLMRAATDLKAWREGSGGGDGDGRRIRFEPASNLLSRDLPETPWLIRGLLIEKAVEAVAAEPKSTKSWMGLEMGVAVSTGTLAFGEFQVRHRGTVAVFLAEDDERSVRNRLRALAAGRDIDPKNALSNVHVRCRGRMDLRDDADLCTLIAECRGLPQPLRLLVLDPLRDPHGADEDRSGEMSEVMGRLRALRDLLGCSVLFVHHSAKASKESSGRREGQRMRGSSVIHGAVDGGIYVTLMDAQPDSWTTKVFAELKSARGAGTFGLKLDVQDDQNDEAVRATWTFSREAPERGAKVEDELVAKVVDLLRKRAPSSVPKSHIERTIGRNAAKTRKAITEAIARGLAEEEWHGEKLVGVKYVQPVGEAS